MEELDIRDYFIILRRWKKLFALTFIVIAVLSLMFAMRWSNYRSTATVQIEQPQISNNVTLPPGVSARDEQQAEADQHLGELQQKVVATASLIDIITKFNLYPGAREKVPVADIADGMRKKIKVEFITNPATTKSAAQASAIAFTVSFDYSNPLLTQQVTDELVTRFLDEDLKERRTQTQETSAFLADQITAMEKSMSEQEQKIADFQKQHGVSRPDALAFNQQAAANAAMNLQNLATQIANNEATIGTLRAQLAAIDPYSRVSADGQVLTTPSVQLKALKSQYATLTAQYGPDHPDVVKVRHQIEALQAQEGKGGKGDSNLKAQIADARTNLEAALNTYGPNHPDVEALKDKLQKLEDQAARSPSTHSAPANGIVGDADNPAYLQVSSQLQAAEEQHKTLLQQQGDLQKTQEQYQNAIIANPEAEQEMASLSRDYENEQMRYRELKEKKMAADMDQQMQEDRKGQRLSVINPPELPLHTQPRRLLLLLGGLAFAFMASLATVAIAQMVSNSVVGARHLEMLTGTAPLVSIPYIYTEEEKAREMRHNPALWWQMISQRLGLS